MEETMSLTQRREDELGRKRDRARIDFRPTADQKQLFEQAAALQGRTLTDFLVASAEESARATLREYEVIELQGKAREDFIAALISPPAPNAKLQKLAERYAQEVETR